MDKQIKKLMCNLFLMLAKCTWLKWLYLFCFSLPSVISHNIQKSHFRGHIISVFSIGSLFCVCHYSKFILVFQFQCFPIFLYNDQINSY